MDEYEGKNIIPPKLNKQFLLAGFTVFEAAFFVVAILGCVVGKQITLLPILSIPAVLCCRMNKESNFMGYLKKLYQYYSTPQLYTAKGVRSVYEASTDYTTV